MAARHRKPPDSLTLFQQPWTGKPSSPCSEEGRQMAQTLGQPGKWARQGIEGHRHCGRPPPVPPSPLHQGRASKKGGNQVGPPTD